MNSFFRGIMSLFSWMDCFHNISPKERVDEILDDFYKDHPWIERNDQKALINDMNTIANDYKDLYERF